MSLVNLRPRLNATALDRNPAADVDAENLQRNFEDIVRDLRAPALLAADETRRPRKVGTDAYVASRGPALTWGLQVETPPMVTSLAWSQKGHGSIDVIKWRAGRIQLTVRSAISIGP